MALSGVLTAQAVGGWRIALLLALAAAVAGVTWWGLAPRIELQEQRAGSAEQRLAESQAMVVLQAGVLAGQQQLLGDLADIERRMQQLGQTVTRNASDQAAAFEELKRNDQAIAAYLAAPVPAALGRLYQRPETTDPAAYRAPDGVQPGAVPPAGAVGGGGE
ncbi:hypothetical protein [Aquipseudomonas alcaligenes]|uniref:Uncharacterized protein n=1 Tax=Aquipseudomonas alcaligenes (strain ATCC 14909 / DSM 50342 / CCUG 1425 / JCM 20561 / NBRC 14159 / NCIMB 9945 / NCTC 10367 / 1577) TaxID=1215092 RepID=U2Z4E8_AQUA1|nr:hypothetical protein [Pseudomonas alcaligenes]GAD62636.1 hypothetical protein PA6_014_00090 [Pseudomonas alcaligenes NBRC 14159]